MVAPGRIELPHSCEYWILSPARLPIPPQGHCEKEKATLSAKSIAGKNTSQRTNGKDWARARTQAKAQSYYRGGKGSWYLLKTWAEFTKTSF